MSNDPNKIGFINVGDDIPAVDEATFILLRPMLRDTIIRAIKAVTATGIVKFDRTNIKNSVVPSQQIIALAMYSALIDIFANDDPNKVEGAKMLTDELLTMFINSVEVAPPGTNLDELEARAKAMRDHHAKKRNMN